MPHVKVAALTEIRPGQMRLFALASHKVVIYNCNGRIHASEAGCPHMGASLHEGVLIGTEVTCPWHHWSFDVATGECTSNPLAPKRLTTFPTTVEQGDIWVDLP